MPDDDLRLADLLAALSVTTDLAMGQEPEKAVRSCLLATELARASGLPEPQVHDVYYTALLQHLGCTAPSHEVTRLFGDDVSLTPQAERTDDTRVLESLALLASVGRGTGVRRAGHVARAVTAGAEVNGAILRSVCEVGTRMAERLRLGAGVREGLRDSLEGWDGRGGAYGRAADEIAVPARFGALATQAVIFDRLAGPTAAVDMVRRRAGRWFDPAVAGTFAAVGADVLRRLAEVDVWTEVLAAEPRPNRRVAASGIDQAAEAFADMVDLKSTFTLGHSSGTAELAVGAAGRLGMSVGAVTTVRRASLLHDLGRVAVPNAVWERRRPLTAAQREQVRLHPYHTERILDRCGALAGLARIAGMHHERQDGSGYHQGAAGSAIPLEARVLAVADVFQAMTQDRPHRPARPVERAAADLEALAGSGALDLECSRAVVEAAGLRSSRRRGGWPSGLSDREVEVLRLLAKGRSNREVASQLVISPRTAEHHVQHIYAKIGSSTRAAAALFAMENGLMR
jgi:HD-GYP domain-containing protein (c-di-GMP phosphodiesterase class II)/DNA-binding CsgD family transcriptional regulator